ncbi:MAG: hypothetical protein AVDCRST_MAG64-697, partial [uncultured Phycisphaerae bacterium]
EASIHICGGRCPVGRRGGVRDERTGDPAGGGAGRPVAVPGQQPAGGHVQAGGGRRPGQADGRTAQPERHGRPGRQGVGQRAVRRVGPGDRAAGDGPRQLQRPARGRARRHGPQAGREPGDEGRVRDEPGVVRGRRAVPPV